MQKAAGYSALHQLTVGCRALLSALGMVGAVWWVGRFLSEGLPDAAIIACMVATGMLVYAGLMLVIGARQVREIRDGMSWFRNHHDGVADAV